jgi:hypothetical protein
MPPPVTATMLLLRPRRIHDIRRPGYVSYVPLRAPGDYKDIPTKADNPSKLLSISHTFLSRLHNII